MPLDILLANSVFLIGVAVIVSPACASGPVAVGSGAAHIADGGGGAVWRKQIPPQPPCSSGAAPGDKGWSQLGDNARSRYRLPQQFSVAEQGPAEEQAPLKD